MHLKPSTSHALISLATFLGVLFAAAAVNYYFDPYHLFKPGLEAKLSENLISGHPTTARHPYNTRRFYRHLVAGFTKTPDVVLLGSARTVRISSKDVGSARFFNHSLPRATLEDYLAIDQLYEKRGSRPKTVIVALEPYQLNAANDFRGWKALEEEYYALADELKIDPNLQVFKNDRLHIANRYRSLISRSSLETSFKTWQDRKKWKRNGWDRVILQTDGSLSDPTQAAREILGEEESSQTFGFENFSRLNPRAQKALEAWVSHLRQKKTRVIFLLLPYPVDFHAQAVAQKWDKRILESEKYVYDLAHKNEIPMYGSFRASITSAHTLLAPAFRHD